MFLYFLQKKEFLAGDRKFLSTQYKKLRSDPEDSDYYSDILEPLFFETLNTLRPKFASKWGKIPYLNGGLFDRDYGVGVKDAAGLDTPKTITLPNGLFDPGDTTSILGFFNSYNFTISENTAGDEDVAVDPEMLGKVFENMLAAEERGQSGTFYTPRGIVQFMCTEVLSRYLADETGIELETVGKLINYDPDLPDSEFNPLITPNQAKALKQAISQVKVLDPAVGSGAFPLGMMQVILNVRQAIARREGMTVQRGSLAISQWKREIIANNLYGVDIKPEAIEIAKLRMWLSLVVDIPTIDNVEPLPNLDYKLMCGDSLISTIHGEQLIPDPTKVQQGMLAVTPIQQAIQPLLGLQQRYFDAQTEERHHLREQILAAEANVFRVAVGDRRNHWLKKQKELEANVKAMKGKVSKAQEKERVEITAKLTELDRFATEVESGERSLNFFQYHLHFRDVFESKGGFDIVIGNPPYVGQKGNKEVFDEIRIGNLGKFFKRGMDLFYFFFHLAFDLLKHQGYSSYITTNYFITADSADILRKDLKYRGAILKLINFGELRIFESAKGQHNLISIFHKTNQQQDKIEVNITDTERKGDANHAMLELILKGYDNQTKYYKHRQIELYDGHKNYIRFGRINNSLNTEKSIKLSFIEHNSIALILDTIKTKSEKLLGDIFNASRGVESGADKVTSKHIQTGLISSDYKARGIYVISSSEIELLNLSPKEMSIIKPFFKNSDIQKYITKVKADKFLLYVTRDLEIEEYPNIFSHLNNFETIIKQRNSNRGEMQAALKLGKWWVLRAATKNPERLKGDKIVCPKWSKRNNFAFNSIEWFAGADVYFIIQKYDDFQLKYLLALLNSSLYYLWLYHRGKRKGESLEMVYTPLTEIPIRQISKAEQKPFIELVDKILIAKQSKPNADTSSLESEIDRLVYQLYDLTEEEIAIVEKSL